MCWVFSHQFLVITIAACLYPVGLTAPEPICTWGPVSFWLIGWASGSPKICCYNYWLFREPLWETLQSVDIPWSLMLSPLMQRLPFVSLSPAHAFRGTQARNPVQTSPLTFQWPFEGSHQRIDLFSHSCSLSWSFNSYPALFKQNPESLNLHSSCPVGEFGYFPTQSFLSKISFFKFSSVSCQNYTRPCLFGDSWLLL